LSELADYRKKSTGTANVPTNTAKPAGYLGQTKAYRWHLEEKESQMTPARIQSLVAWVSNGTRGAWEERLSELADYRKSWHTMFTKTTAIKPVFGRNPDTIQATYLEGNRIATDFPVSGIGCLGFDSHGVHLGRPFEHRPQHQQYTSYRLQKRTKKW
jgi:hypothetical protein